MSLRRGQPADRRQGGKGPGRPDAESPKGGTTAQATDCYKGLIDALVYDEADGEVELDVRPIVTKTLMTDAAARRRLAEAALEAAAALR